VRRAVTRQARGSALLARRVSLVVALLGLAPGQLEAQHAPPAHCERAVGGGPWPAIGEPLPAEATPVSRAEARRAVRVFRRHWARVRHPSAVLRAFTECMDASEEHFVVSRVPRALVVSTLGGPGEHLAGSADTVPDTPWLWHVYWGGASRRFVPSGPVSAFFTPDLRTFVGALQHLEG
jgi:hypothetical protein